MFFEFSFPKTVWVLKEVLTKSHQSSEGREERTLSKHGRTAPGPLHLVHLPHVPHSGGPETGPESEVSYSTHNYS